MVDISATFVAVVALGMQQLALGLCIPALLMFHVTATRIAEGVLGVRSNYSLF
jgi:hypothetical protein